MIESQLPMISFSGLMISIADPFYPVRAWKARGTECKYVYQILLNLAIIFMRNKDVCTDTPVNKCTMVQ